MPLRVSSTTCTRLRRAAARRDERVDDRAERAGTAQLPARAATAGDVSASGPAAFAATAAAFYLDLQSRIVAAFESFEPTSASSTSAGHVPKAIA